MCQLVQAQVVPECRGCDVTVAVIHLGPVNVIVEQEINAAQDDGCKNSRSAQHYPEAPGSAQALFETVLDSQPMQVLTLVVDLFHVLIDKVDVPVFDEQQSEDEEDCVIHYSPCWCLNSRLSQNLYLAKYSCAV